MTLEEFELSLQKDEALRQAVEALHTLSYALRRAEGTMRQPAKYVAEAQGNALSAITAITKVLEKP